MALLIAKDAAQTANDSKLIQAAQRDARAFGPLYERYVDRVYRYVLVRVGSRADAEDITSQTFMAALERLPRYRGDGVFAAWLFGIARYKVADHYRHRQPGLDLDAAEAVPDGNPGVDDTVNTLLQTARVAAKLQALAPERAEVIALRFFGHLTVADIALLLDKRQPAVRMLLHRGLRDLQQQLVVEQETSP